MIRIAVTGGIACGKSTLARCWGEQGVSVCDADGVAHAVMAPGAEAFEGVVAAFGRSVLGADGCIDRAALGKRIFADAGQRELLNRLVHPAVRERCLGWLAGLDPASVAATLVVPLLYEAGFDGDGWDAVVCVTALPAVQVARLTARGLTEEDAVLRIGAQMPVREKERRADFVVVNNGSMDLLICQSKKVLKSILER